MTERLIHTQERQTRCWWRYYVATTADANSTECVSQQELAAVKAEMEKKVDQLHSQLHYWQSVNVDNIFRNHCSSSYDSGIAEVPTVQGECTIAVVHS